MDLSDPHHFERVYAEHERAVTAAAYRVLGDAALAQDVAQDVFLRVWRNPHAYDARRGQLGSYLRLMARSRAIDLYREGQAAGRARDRLAAVAPYDEAAPEDRPAEAARRAEERVEVGAALSVLPDAQREALVLTYWAGLTADEIARRASVPLGTAKSRVRLGLAKLRDELASAASVTENQSDRLEPLFD
jgi:RNA polymerase sigma-70 factor (ECF subfamily)